MSTVAEAQVLSARWVFPATDPPIEGGTVTIAGSRIVAVDPAGQRMPDVDLGNVALIPGLVNAHTHLDLTGMRGLVPPSKDFVGWLRAVIAHRRSRNTEQTATDIREGVKESLDHGTTLIGDIASLGSSWNLLAEAPLWAVCFREILGLPVDRVNAVWTELIEWMEHHPDTATCRAGVSPHAPYSVHRALIEAAARIWPVCIHAAESMEELELLESRSGPFLEFLQDLGVWDSTGLAPSADWVAWKASRSPAASLAHGNYFAGNMRFSANTSVVYCPRTHAAFEHPEHPFQQMAANGTRVAIGTDSLASNPDLDILAEARFVQERHPEVSGELILRMATIHGAESLGFGLITGSIEVGKSADLLAIPLGNDKANDPHDLLFKGKLPNQPRRTMWRGKWR